MQEMQKTFFIHILMHYETRRRVGFLCGGLIYEAVWKVPNESLPRHEKGESSVLSYSALLRACEKNI